MAAASLEERTPSAMASADAVAPAELLGAKKGAKLASRDELSQVRRIIHYASHYVCLARLTRRAESGVLRPRISSCMSGLIMYVWAQAERQAIRRTKKRVHKRREAERSEQQVLKHA